MPRNDLLKRTRGRGESYLNTSCSLISCDWVARLKMSDVKDLKNLMTLGFINCVQAHQQMHI